MKNSYRIKIALSTFIRLKPLRSLNITVRSGSLDRDESYSEKIWIYSRIVKISVVNHVITGKEVLNTVRER